VLTHEFHEKLELLAIHRLGHVGPAHMVHHDGGGQGGEEIPELRRMLLVDNPMRLYWS
jgi:hypothetical protein